MRKFFSFLRPRFLGVVPGLIGTSLCVGLAVGSVAHADVPVFLKLDSRFPSGVHPRDWLEARTKETQVQRWFRVTVGDAYGWVPEDHVLTAIKLSSIARMVRDEPDRSAPQMDALRTRRIAKGSQVIILEVAGSWSRARVLGDGTPNRDSWILNEALVRDPGNQIERGMTFRDTPLRMTPKADRKAFDHLSAFKEIAVLSTVPAEKTTWLEIQLDRGTAWIERKNVWLPHDLRDGSIRTMQPGLELRSSPLPGADVVKRLEGHEILKVVNARYLRWGRVKVPEHGLLWWPISEDRNADGPNAIPPLKLTTQDLVSRTIYDMAASQSIPGLRFASAKGVFKSRDGIEWSIISKFETSNYPIAIAKNGLLFVGPYLSSDHGENFEQWIRWDRLVEAVKKQTGSPPARVRLSAVETTDPDGRNVNLVLDVGRSKPVRIGTPDRGLSWKIF